MTRQHRHVAAAVVTVLVATVAVTAGAGNDTGPEAGDRTASRAAASGPSAPTTAARTPPTTLPPTTAPTTTTTPLPRVHLDPMEVTVLVDLGRGLPEDWTPPDLVAAAPRHGVRPSSDHRLRGEAAVALAGLLAAADADGIDLVVLSAFRSEDRQRGLYPGGRRTPEGGVTRAPPGHSEHQTGLAVDVGDTAGCDLRRCFADRPAGRWVATSAADHGWIVRYPQGKESVTGYAFEPWHLRYVGVELAGALTEAGLTLDEYAAIHGVTP